MKVSRRSRITGNLEGGGQLSRPVQGLHNNETNNGNFFVGAFPYSAAGGYKVWKKLSFFVAMPAVGLCMLNAYLKHQEEHGHPQPEFVKYEHLRIRNKRFPWGEGNKSLFHNPHTNPLPDGYEH